MGAFSLWVSLNEPKSNNTKRTYESWRKEVSKHRPYSDANKLANVRRNTMNKKRLTVRKQTKAEKPKPVAVKMENLPPEQIENPI